MKVAYQTISVLREIITGDGGITPYRTGGELVTFFDELDPSLPTLAGGSRGSYTEGVLRQINATPILEAAITSVFDPRAFLGTEYDIETSISLLNEYLKFDGYEVYKDGLFYRCREISPAHSSATNRKVKNLIFAANGPKPEIVLEDAVHNDIRIVKNAEHCLVYEEDIPEDGLVWDSLLVWWAKQRHLDGWERIEQERSLYTRLNKSLDSEPEKWFFAAYFELFRESLAPNLPALIPQVYLHYDPYTVVQLAGKKRLFRQRMDFLLLLSDGLRVVIEIDGQQHYASLANSGQWVSSPHLYSQMVAEDRRLKLAGYDVYRFGGHELSRKDDVKHIAKEFFSRLFKL